MRHYHDAGAPPGDVADPAVRLARPQHGVMSRAQLLAAGLSPAEVATRVRRGSLRRLHRGVYILGPLTGPFEPEHAREMAAVLACGDGAVVSHWSAAALLGLAPRRPPAEPVDVAVPGRRPSPRRPGIRGHRLKLGAPDEVVRVDGIPTTAVGRTLLDLSPRATPRTLERLVAAALRSGQADPARLRSLAARRRGQPGARRLRAVLEQAGGPAFTRSEAEDRFLALVRSGGLPAPEVNAVHRGRELDFLWRRHGLAVEVDGFRFHGARRHFEGDRARDAAVVASGLTVMRVTWRHLVEQPAATLVRVAQALAWREGRDT